MAWWRPRVVRLPFVPPRSGFLLFCFFCGTGGRKIHKRHGILGIVGWFLGYPLVNCYVTMGSYPAFLIGKWTINWPCSIATLNYRVEPRVPDFWLIILVLVGWGLQHSWKMCCVSIWPLRDLVEIWFYPVLATSWWSAMKFGANFSQIHRGILDIRVSVGLLTQNLMKCPEFGSIIPCIKGGTKFTTLSWLGMGEWCGLMW